MRSVRAAGAGLAGLAPAIVRLSTEGHAFVDAERSDLLDVVHFAEGNEGLNLAGGVVFAQRVPDELGVEQDAPQVRVADEGHPEHVEALTLHPVGGRPE